MCFVALWFKNVFLGLEVRRWMDSRGVMEQLKSDRDMGDL